MKLTDTDWTNLLSCTYHCFAARSSVREHVSVVVSGQCIIQGGLGHLYQKFVPDLEQCVVCLFVCVYRKLLAQHKMYTNKLK
jgi:hypothetical protein